MRGGRRWTAFPRSYRPFDTRRILFYARYISDLGRLFIFHRTFSADRYWGRFPGPNSPGLILSALRASTANSTLKRPRIWSAPRASVAADPNYDRRPEALTCTS